MHRCEQKKEKILQNRTCWPPSLNQVGHPRPNSTSCTLFILFVQQTCQNIARMIEITSISLVYRMHGWAVPQNIRMVHQIWSYNYN